jgi:flavodoxin
VEKMKHVVIYYSYEGATALVSEFIAKTLNADLVSLKPLKEPSLTGFGKYAWGGAMVMMKKKPLLEAIDIDFNQYDVIWIGTPVWAWTYTPPLRTFFHLYTIKAKKVMLFCTHEGQMGKTLEHMASSLSASNQFMGAIGFKSVMKRTSEVQQEVLTWIQQVIK